MSSPIIFIHFGYSKYLHSTLRAAKHFNPKTRVILLGDKNNKRIAEKTGAEFFNFSDYKDCPRVKEFNEVFKVVGGKKFNTRGNWCRFVFQRWFYIYNFCVSQKIIRFWSFDSDVLILCRLSKVESRYAKYDFTRLCNGKCMSGLINNMKSVRKYTGHMITLFKDKKFIQGMLDGDFKGHPYWGFTEMRALVAYEKKFKPNSFRLDTIVKDSFFDICMFQHHGYARENNMKKIIWKGNKPFCKKGGKLIRLLAANMSFREHKMPGILKKAIG